MQDGPDVLQDGVDALGHGGPLGTREEVRDSGHDASGGLGPDLLEARSKQLEVTTLKNLGGLESWIRTATLLVHIVLDVGITQQGEASNLRHFFVVTCP